jgi:RNA polymerase sigma factor (sigma-70 family)
MDTALEFPRVPFVPLVGQAGGNSFRDTRPNACHVRYREEMTLDARQAEALFLEHLPTIDRLLTSVSRRQRLSREAAEDFGSWAKMRLIQDGYAILRKFRGESAITTYLAVVLSLLLRDYRVQEWGRWRPSAAAQRAGSVAVRLEVLVRRDGLTLTSAGQVLRTSGATQLADRDLAALLSTLPERDPLRPVTVGVETLAEVPAPDSADGIIDAEAAAADRRRALNALEQALAGLSDEDRLIVRMHFWRDMSVADIARALGVAQKPLYRRIERALKTVRVRCVAAGIRWPISGERVE